MLTWILNIVINSSAIRNLIAWCFEVATERTVSLSGIALFLHDIFLLVSNVPARIKRPRQLHALSNIKPFCKLIPSPIQKSLQFIIALSDKMLSQIKHPLQLITAISNGLISLRPLSLSPFLVRTLWILITQAISCLEPPILDFYSINFLWRNTQSLISFMLEEVLYTWSNSWSHTNLCYKKVQNHTSYYLLLA